MTVTGRAESAQGPPPGRSRRAPHRQRPPPASGGRRTTSLSPGQRVAIPGSPVPTTPPRGGQKQVCGDPARESESET